MSGISIKGIILGVVAVLVTDVVAGIGLTVALADEGSLKSKEAIAQLTHSEPFLIGSVFFGTLSTVLGGYVAARIAKRSQYANAAVIGVLGVTFGVMLSGGYPFWFNAIAFLLVLPAAIWGGHIAAPRAQEK
jgi:fructose-specific phosphotransferase system IIC component